MKDGGGRVTIAGWYDDVEPLGETERRAIAEAPQYDNELKSQLALATTDGEGKSLLEQINLPSLNINGMSSGDVRDPTDDEARQHPLIARVVHRSGGYNAERTPMDLPVSLAVIKAVQSTSAGPIVKLPTPGGSLPLSIIT